MMMSPPYVGACGPQAPTTIKSETDDYSLLVGVLIRCKTLKSTRCSGEGIMGNWIDGNGIHLDTQIQAADLNAVANFYRRTFGVSYTAPSQGARITANDFNTLRQAIVNGAGSAYSVGMPGVVNTNDRIMASAWGNPIFRAKTYTYTNPGTYTLVVPTGANFLSVNQLVGGGGGSKAWWDQVSWGGGQHGSLSSYGKTGCSAGSTITIVIGSGGSGGEGAYGWGSNGGNSVVSLNGNVLSSAAGGAGGTNYNQYGRSDWASLYGGYGAGAAGGRPGEGNGGGSAGTGGYASITLYPN